MDLLKEAKIALRLEKHEAAISLWRYEGEYAFYNRPLAKIRCSVKIGA